MWESDRVAERKCACDPKRQWQSDRVTECACVCEREREWERSETMRSSVNIFNLLKWATKLRSSFFNWFFLLPVPMKGGGLKLDQRNEGPDVAKLKACIQVLDTYLRSCMSLGSGCGTAVEHTSHNRKDVGSIPARHCFYSSSSIFSNVFLNRSLEEVQHCCFPIWKSRWMSSLGTEGRSFLVQETDVQYCDRRDYLKHNCSIK